VSDCGKANAESDRANDSKDGLEGPRHYRCGRRESTASCRIHGSTRVPRPPRVGKCGKDSARIVVD